MKTALWLISWFAWHLALGAARDIEVTGVVRDSETGDPIHHAMVTATVWTRDEHPHREIVVALSGEDGKFRFVGLPEGAYAIGAEKAGYRGADGQRSSHSDGGSYTNLVLHLTRLAVITGTVRDDRGLPIDGAHVGISFGLGKFYVSNPVTDQDGTFRAALLSRGRYSIGVFSPGNGTLLRARGLTFLPVYYPGTTDATAAAWIDLAPGQEIHVDLRVSPIPAYEIRGRFEADGTLIAVSVLPAGNDDYRVVWGLARHEDGSREFRISGLAPGLYVLNLQVGISSRSVFFHKTVQVANADVTNVVVSSTDGAVQGPRSKAPTCSVPWVKWHEIGSPQMWLSLPQRFLPQPWWLNSAVTTAGYNRSSGAGSVAGTLSSAARKRSRPPRSAICSTRAQPESCSARAAATIRSTDTCWRAANSAICRYTVSGTVTLRVMLPPLLSQGIPAARSLERRSARPPRNPWC